MVNSEDNPYHDRSLGFIPFYPDGKKALDTYGRIVMLFYIIPHGLLGGALWCCSNVAVLISVKMLGLGIGFTLYHTVNCVCGYLIGRL